MKINLLAEGGNLKPGPGLSQKLGPIGININEVIKKVNEATKDMKGLKVPVELDIDAGTKEFTIKVSSPPVSELLKKQLGIEKASGDQARIKAGNIPIEKIIEIAKTKQGDLLCKDLKASVKTVIGSCVSLGLLIDNKPALEILEEVEQGKFDEEIKEEKTEPSPEKVAEMKEYFAKIKAEQDKMIAQEKAAQEAKEAKKNK